MRLFRKPLTQDRALRKMCRIAGYRYEDCLDGSDWLYQKTWTQAKSDRFKRWFVKQLPYWKKQYATSQWAMFDLCYGFKVEEKRSNWLRRFVGY